jgi:hypothetical protein
MHTTARCLQTGSPANPAARMQDCPFGRPRWDDQRDPWAGDGGICDALKGPGSLRLTRRNERTVTPPGHPRRSACNAWPCPLTPLQRSSHELDCYEIQAWCGWRGARQRATLPAASIAGSALSHALSGADSQTQATDPHRSAVRCLQVRPRLIRDLALPRSLAQDPGGLLRAPAVETSGRTHTGKSRLAC